MRGRGRPRAAEDPAPGARTGRLSGADPELDSTPSERSCPRRGDCSRLLLLQRSERHRRPVQCAYQLSREHRGRPAWTQRRLRSGATYQSGRDRTGKRLELHRRLFGTPGRRQSRWPSVCLQLRCRGGPAARRRMLPHMARERRCPLARRCRLIVDCCGLPLDSLQPRPATGLSIVLRVPGRTVGLHGGIERTQQGSQSLMLDGSVKLVQPSIDPKVWKNFAAIADPAPCLAKPLPRDETAASMRIVGEQLVQRQDEARQHGSAVSDWPSSIRTNRSTVAWTRTGRPPDFNPPSQDRGKRCSKDCRRGCNGR